MDNSIMIMVGMAFLTIFLSYPIRFIKNRKTRYLYSFILGFLMQVIVFQKKVVIIHVQNLIVFFLMKFKGRQCGALITIWAIAYLSLYQIYQMIVNYGGWTLDASALLMICTCKYSLFAYAYQDGGQPKDKLTKEQAYNSVQQLPRLYDFFGYLTFLPTAIMGPVIEYSDYKNFMQRKGPFTNIPSVWKEAGIVLAKSISCAVVFMVGQEYFPINYLRSDEFLERGPFYIMGYAWIAVTFLRFKYYFGWKLTLCSVITSGIGYSNQSKKFNHINSINITQFETNLHIREKIGYWNMSVQEWLRKSIYQRSPFKSKAKSQLWVFMVSALWHGFYAGYYFSFFLWFLQVHLQGQIFKSVKNENAGLKKLYEKTGKLGNIVLRVLVIMLMSINACFFAALSAKTCIKLLFRMYFIPQIIMFVGIFIFSYASKSKKHERLHQIPVSDQEKARIINNKRAD